MAGGDCHFENLTLAALYKVDQKEVKRAILIMEISR